MRIISGKYKGRKVEGYNIDGTRPTMDRVKESVMGIIQNHVKNSVCLDLFAGSGSVGIELLSNGAGACYFVDNNKKVIETLKKNLETLKVSEKYYLYLYDYNNALKKFHEENVKFDIIFLDPPYQNNYINPCLELIEKYDLLNSGGIVICEYENELIESGLSLIKEKRYGSKNIKIFKRN